MTTTIYGKLDCERCNLAKHLFPEAEYRDHKALFDQYDMDTATDIVTNSGGELPIIVIESFAGRLVLGPSKSTVAAECSNGTCAIPKVKESILGHENAK